ncbi:type IVB secretion system protein IcmF [Legionella waltersii]|uniref:IcmF n=1 Tax=Legionella waltersii TaxID=66969 RepID=A0A0W1A2E6_9GAMM|nr:type IVB secretion system protein IcmF [Legionella waltersii]KTD75554.1 IcmF [Legionella waltersii]SNU98670.1 IcmF [Legionella waltersii]
MDNSLNALCDAIKKVVSQLKPQGNPMSFLVLTGKSKQGKTALLKQSKMEEVPVLSEEHAKIYYNARGIVVELGESWLTNSKNILQNTFKQLNKCHRHLKISGLVLCIDVNDLLIGDSNQFAEQKKSHLQLLHRLGLNLGYQTELALFFTKMDTLAGFSEFYQTDHASDLSKPLGFSLECINQPKKKAETYTQQFNHLIETLGHQVIQKMHPARSTIKRSLIREFPLQVASLRTPIQSLIQAISPKIFHLHSIFFTSAEQGGVSVDRLNKKIEHEYALVVQDTFPQATNFRAYFIEGAIKAAQDQSSQVPQVTRWSQKPIMAITAGLAGISLMLLMYSHYKTSNLLDEASKELLAYDALAAQQSGNRAQALYHLSKATKEMDLISSNAISLPTVHRLKLSLHNNTNARLHGEFLPSLTNELEQVIISPTNTPITRYKALKIYIMLTQPDHFSAAPIVEWFKNQWQNQPGNATQKQIALLEQTLTKPLDSLVVKPQVISDARNYLNALPTGYLFYSIAKEYFPSEKQKVDIEGFNLPTNAVPVYFTKHGFSKIVSELPKISATLQAENWVLARQDLSQLQPMLLQAYCFDYVTWWQTFMKKSHPLRYNDYQEGRVVTKTLKQSNAFYKFVQLIQQETKPDLSESDPTFNQNIANRFTDLNLMSLSVIKELNMRITELEHFISTISVVNDKGKTAFTVTRSRFINENSSDPVSLLYIQARQLPEPIKGWTQQIAGDTWVLLIRDSRQYVNYQWRQTVYKEFQHSIAQRYPFENTHGQEIAIDDFNRFFSTNGILNTFSEQYIKPFLDTSSPEWKPKPVNDFVFPLSSEAIDEMIRANIITNMFFPDHGDESKILFSLQKISLDPVVSKLVLEIGDTQLTDNQNSESIMRFSWPQDNAKLTLDSIEGNHYELAEEGTWALFKLLEKVNVLIDDQDSSNLQILFEVNSNSGRYLMKTNNQINPFTPGILNGFTLTEHIA